MDIELVGDALGEGLGEEEGMRFKGRSCSERGVAPSHLGLVVLGANKGLRTWPPRKSIGRPLLAVLNQDLQHAFQGTLPPALRSSAN